MADEQRSYLSYLLRLWWTSNDGQPVWRASLESVQTGERRGFANLESLLTYLKDQTSPSPGRGVDIPSMEV